MNVIVVGAGRLGSQAADVLTQQGNQVTLIDQDQERLAAPELPDVARTLTGDGCEPAILEEAGAFATDLLIAATGEDEDNLVISLLAKRTFHVGRVVARINESENAWLFDDRWGVDVAVPAAAPLISLIEEATGAADTVPLLRLARAGVNLIETVIDEHSSAAGRRLHDIALPSGCVVAAVIRHGQPTVPAATFTVRAGDELLVVAQTATGEEIERAFH